MVIDIEDISYTLFDAKIWKFFDTLERKFEGRSEQ